MNTDLTAAVADEFFRWVACRNGHSALFRWCCVGYRTVQFTTQCDNHPLQIFLISKEHINEFQICLHL